MNDDVVVDVRRVFFQNEKNVVRLIEPTEQLV